MRNLHTIKYCDNKEAFYVPLKYGEELIELGDRFPDYINKESIENVEIHLTSSGYCEIPKDVCEMKKLSTIYIPTLKCLNNFTAPASLKFIQAYGEDNILTESTYLPSIEKIILPYFQDSNLSMRHFPNIKALRIGIDKSNSLMNRLSEFDFLEELEVYPVKEGNFFEFIKDTNISSLYIIGGKRKKLINFSSVIFEKLTTLRMGEFIFNDLDFLQYFHNLNNVCIEKCEILGGISRINSIEILFKNTKIGNVLYENEIGLGNIYLTKD